MDTDMENRPDEPPSKKSKLDCHILGLTEADKFHAVPSDEMSGYHSHFNQGAYSKNPIAEGSNFSEDFQVLDEFAAGDEEGDFSFSSRKDEDGNDDMIQNFDDDDDDDDEDDEDDTDSLGSEIDALLDEGLPEMYNKEPKRKRGSLLEMETGASREMNETLPDGVVGVRTKTILRSEYSMYGSHCFYNMYSY